ncbi:MAG TPA: discoidin domain-containing protein, partial [Clostridiaceae bacterium]|nr:discoidin domain-containing protein [Clostridiaceae bacterium]
MNKVSVEQAPGTTGVAKIKVIDANNEEEGIYYTVTFFVLTDKRVIASGDDGNVPENTIDGDLGTRWSAAGEQWIQYYLGGVQKVNGLTIATFRGNERKAYFDIQTTIDGVNWTTVHTGGASGTTDKPEVYKFEPVEAVYVRIMGYGNSDNNWNSFTEVIIHTGDDIPEIPAAEDPSGGDAFVVVEGAELLK